jgi:hypothetical protein
MWLDVTWLDVTWLGVTWLDLVWLDVTQLDALTLTPSHPHTCITSYPRTLPPSQPHTLAASHPHNPLACRLRPQPKLDLALNADSAVWLDIAVEVPGFWEYLLPATARAGRLPVTRFFPTMRSHGGGTWRWRCGGKPEQRTRLMVTSPLPSNRTAAGYTTRTLARAIAREGLRPSFADMMHLLAYLVLHVSMYHAPHHSTGFCISNDLSTTTGGVRAHIAECREAMSELLDLMRRGQFAMRMEVRFMRLAEVVAADLPEGSTVADAARELAQDVNTALFWWHAELFDVDLHCEAITPELLTEPSMHLGVMEAILASLDHHFHTAGRSVSLADLGTLPLQLQRELCLARAKLFKCTATEKAVIEATDSLAALVSNAAPLEPSKGAVRAAQKEAKEAAAAAAEEAAGEADASPPASPAAAAADEPAMAAADDSSDEAAEAPPQPQSLYELWLQVARYFKRATQLQAIMSILCGPSSILRPDRQRMRRRALERAFAGAMEQHDHRSVCQMVLDICPAMAPFLP